VLKGNPWWMILNYHRFGGPSLLRKARAHDVTSKLDEKHPLSCRQIRARYVSVDEETLFPRMHD
jgi:hypothetical protein